jgi:hypothetical protein
MGSAEGSVAGGGVIGSRNRGAAARPDSVTIEPKTDSDPVVLVPAE